MYAFRLSGGGVAVAIRDTGIGIPADKLRAIQTPFDQVIGVTAASAPRAA